MTDQKTMWDDNHAAHKLAFGVKPSKFAQEISNQIKAGDKVLELGCGAGGDARLFAEQGAEVVATDFSDVVIKRNKTPNSLSGLTFEVLDITSLFSYDDASFHVVYAHLSLHYYDNAKTIEIFQEIARVLKPGGRLFFACKSTHDRLYGEGVLLEQDMYDLNGHIRHFFSIDYARELLSADFEIIRLEECDGTYSGKISSFIRCWAFKK